MFGVSSAVNDMNTSQTTGMARISFGGDAIGYTLTACAFAALVALYGAYWVSRLVRCNMLKDNKVYIPDAQMTQRGFVDSRFGWLLKALTFLFGLWLQTAMLMAIIGHYEDQWPFDLSRPEGSVDWDSFTRVFLAAWIASIVMAVAGRFTRKRMDSFYLRPSSLSAARYVKLSQVVNDRDTRGLSVAHEAVVEVQTKPNRHVNFSLSKLVWSDAEGMFVPVLFFNRDGPRGTDLDAIKRVGGLSTTAAADRVKDMGRNEISLEVPSLARMMGTELSSFFYVYQISAGCLLNLYWDYITAGFLVLLIILGSALIKVVMERREKIQLREIATLHGSVWVQRDGHWTKVTSEELVVGDLICLSTDSIDTTRLVTVDCALVSGSAVVDESALTGETMPVQKFTPAPSTANHPMSINNPENKKHYLFAGTTLLQGSDSQEKPGSITNGALAVVTAGGSGTVRGELIKGLLFGSSAKSLFWAEFVVAIVILVILALLNFIAISSSYSFSMSTLLPALSSIVGLISPLLTVALLGGELRSAKRLKASGIHCRDLHRLTMAGKTDMVLLDKTGTITKSGLEFRGVVPASSMRLTECADKSSPVTAEMSACIALAHTVSRCNGELVGHQVELRMVETATRLGWKLGGDLRAPTDPAGNVWEVERLFPFSHETMTMSAIVIQKASGQRFGICKGSFDALAPKCTDVSAEMKQAVGIYAQEGCFILGVAMKEMPPVEAGGAPGEIVREHVEKELGFVGLLLFRNEVKPDSEKCVSELKGAGIDVAMLTGDSVFTGSAVARTVGMIGATSRVVIGVIDEKTKLIEYRLADTDSLISEDSLAGDANAILCITGDVYEMLKAEGKLDFDRTKVFARVSPSQKAEIVKMFIDSGKTVVMCGDGANDSIALRSAHAGLAINSKAEASVAAPFSSDSESLSALTLLIREARSALCTSLAAYRYLVAIGILQTLSKVVLFLQCGGFLSGVACLFIDCLVVPLMLYCICSALPAATLAAKAPEGSLLGPEMILGTAWTVVAEIIALAIMEAVMVNADWYVPFTTSAPLSSWRERTDSFESALIVLFRIWVYVDMALVYSYGSDHRQPMMKNWRLVTLAAILIGLVVYLLFGPVGVLQAALVVQVNREVAIASGSTFFNHFLFYYEKIGSVWYGVTDSIEYPMAFRGAIIAILFFLSVVHHLGFRLWILGPVSRWFHNKVGWKDGSCSCCRRRRPKGYRPIGVTVKKIDALDESILSAGEHESPAAEWELRRTYGRWRSPTEPEYK